MSACVPPFFPAIQRTCSCVKISGPVSVSLSVYLATCLLSWLAGCVMDVCTFLTSLPLTLPYTILTTLNRDIESYKGDWTAAAAHTDKLIMRDLVSDAKLSSPLPAASEFNKSPARKTAKDLNNGENECE